MNKMIFEWDAIKARANIEKHNVTFEEAATVFSDECAVLFDDPDHSDLEERFLLIGFSSGCRLLVVCHCVRSDDAVIRLISARKATKKEQGTYMKFNG